MSHVDLAPLPARVTGASALRLAVVGCGAVAEMGHIPAACKTPGATLVGLVDTEKGRAARLAERFGVGRVAEDLLELAEDADAIILATPPHIRPALATAAFRAGLHVLCEKPLANTAAECRSIIGAARQANRVLAVAHTARFFANRIRARSYISDNILGRLNRVTIEQGSPYDWPVCTGYTVRRELVAGGVLLNEGIHSLDTLLWWFGAPLQFEYEDDALGGIESNARLNLTFPHGVAASLRLSRTCKLSNRITVEGEKGKITLPLYGQSELVLAWNNRRSERQSLQQHDFDFVALVREQLENFLQSAETGNSPRATGEDGLNAVELIERCYQTKRARPIPKTVPGPGLTW